MAARSVRPSIVLRVASLAAVLIVAAVVGVSVGGALLAGLGVTLGVAAGVIGLAMWRRRRRPWAVVAYVVAGVAFAGAIIGFLDAIG